MPRETLVSQITEFFVRHQREKFVNLFHIYYRTINAIVGAAGEGNDGAFGQLYLRLGHAGDVR